MVSPAPEQEFLTAPTRGQDLPRHVYPVRSLGVAAGLLCIAGVFREIDAPWHLWAGVAFHGAVWPHLAYFFTTRSRDPWSTERLALVVDSAMAGVWLPLMGFNVLPSVLIASMMSLGVLSVGGIRLLTPAMAAMFATGAATMLIASPAVRVETSYSEMLFCLPLILLYPFFIGVATYRLRHRIRDQAKQLEHLARTERLSGLTTRQHWEEALQAEFERCRRGGPVAGLILLDVDDFKRVNDRYGHLAGDEVIRRMGEALRAVLRPGDVACRYGGDEFGMLVKGSDAAGAAIAAERVREAISRFRLNSAPELRCTASLGVAEVGPGFAKSLDAVEAADRALYLAKAAGRNRVHVLGT